MYIDDNMLEALRADPIMGMCQLRNQVFDFMQHDSDWDDESYSVLKECYALMIEMEDLGILSFRYSIADLTGDLRKDCQLMWDALEGVYKECKMKIDESSLHKLREKFRIGLNAAFSYEFSQGDLDRVQVLINQLRDHISAADFEPNHKQRLLARLEKIQSELHKKVSDLDRLWGLIGDAGVAVGKLGTDAKPIVDRIREIAGIVWKTQARAEELPSGSEIPMIGGEAE